MPVILTTVEERDVGFGNHGARLAGCSGWCQMMPSGWSRPTTRKTLRRALRPEHFGRSSAHEQLPSRLPDLGEPQRLFRAEAASFGQRLSCSRISCAPMRLRAYCSQLERVQRRFAVKAFAVFWS